MMEEQLFMEVYEAKRENLMCTNVQNQTAYSLNSTCLIPCCPSVLFLTRPWSLWECYPAGIC